MPCLDECEATQEVHNPLVPTGARSKASDNDLIIAAAKYSVVVPGWAPCIAC